MSATEILEQIEHLPRAEQQAVAEQVWEKFGDFDNEIYAVGDSRDINESIEKFLGRPRSIEPFLKRIGISNEPAAVKITPPKKSWWRWF